MPVTSSKIAELAGVSRGTVDRALNNRGGVNPEVEKRIKSIAKRLGYTPNRAGKALASRKNPPKLGVVLSSVGNSFFDEVKQGIADAERELSDFGLKVLLKESKGYIAENQLAAMEELAAQGVRGIAIMPVNDQRVAQKMNELSDRGIAFVTLNTDIEGTRRLAYIGCDYIKSGKTAAGLANLLTQGRANLLIVIGSVKNRGHNLRIYGFGRAIKNEMDGIRIVDIVENEDDNLISYRVTSEKLREHPEIDLVYIVSAGVAGAVRAVAEQEHPIQVLSFDATEEIASLVRAGEITATICQEPYRQGYRSIYTLFDYLVNGIPPQEEYLYTGCEIKIKENLS